MVYFCLFYVVLIFSEIYSSKIDKTINDYFKGETFNNFQKQWQSDRKSYENAIRLGLRDNYGYKGMNVYIRKSVDSHRIANGFYVHDNVVGVMCQDLFLGELPHFTTPEVTMALASNAIRIETGLSNMFVYTQYIVFRNHSDVMRGGEDPTDRSPFTHQDVQYSGPLAIIAEDCTLSGYAIAKLSGQSVDLGHNTFAVSGCKFSVEISALGMGISPVTAPYFNSQQSKELEKLISRPIREELLPKLQASLLTYVNTSNIFGKKLVQYRQQQTKLFKETSKYFMKLVRALNKNTVQINQGLISLNPLFIMWDVCDEKPCETRVWLKDLNLYGLDTVYSSYNGGPYKLQTIKIGESVRFNVIQVRGRIGFKNDSITSENDFFVELNDVAINIEIDMGKDINVCDFVDWRSIELSIIGFKGNFRERVHANSLISGHLLNEIPKVLIEHTLQLFGNKNKPNKLSYYLSGEKYSDINPQAHLSKSLEYEDKKRINGMALKKVKFNKKGEVSKSSKLNSQKQTFDKRGEVRKTTEADLEDDTINNSKSVKTDGEGDKLSAKSASMASSIEEVKDKETSKHESYTSSHESHGEIVNDKSTQTSSTSSEKNK